MKNCPFFYYLPCSIEYTLEWHGGLDDLFDDCAILIDGSLHAMNMGVKRGSLLPWGNDGCAGHTVTHWLRWRAHKWGTHCTRDTRCCRRINWAGARWSLIFPSCWAHYHNGGNGGSECYRHRINLGISAGTSATSRKDEKIFGLQNFHLELR